MNSLNKRIRSIVSAHKLQNNTINKLGAPIKSQGRSITKMIRTQKSILDQLGLSVKSIKGLKQLLKSQISINGGSSNDIDANGYEYVDLGLPSGTLWATCNVGANQPDELGLYFPWASTQGYTYAQLHTFDFTTGNTPYIDGNKQNISKINKYNNGVGDYAGNVDNLIELLPEDDAARANMGGTWLMPSKADFAELKEYCTWNWNDSGYEVVGPNGNSIFFPAAGYGNGTSINDLDSYGSYWSRNLYTSDAGYAYYMDFSSDDVNSEYEDFRFGGNSVRGVLKH